MLVTYLREEKLVFLKETNEELCLYEGIIVKSLFLKEISPGEISLE